MITKEDLEAAGYKKYKAPITKEFASALYQKRFDDEVGKKYFINFYEYDNRELKNSGRFVDMKDFTYSADTQFNMQSNTFNVDLLHPQSIKEAEEFFEKMWVTMKCDYYEEWSK